MNQHPKQFNRTRAYYRHQRKRAIARKMYIFHDIQGNELAEFHNGTVYPFVPGKFAKGKVHCSCKMCKYDKVYHIEKEKVKAQEKWLKQEVESYFNEHC